MTDDLGTDAWWQRTKARLTNEILPPEIMSKIVGMSYRYGARWKMPADDLFQVALIDLWQRGICPESRMLTTIAFRRMVDHRRNTLGRYLPNRDDSTGEEAIPNLRMRHEMSRVPLGESSEEGVVYVETISDPVGNLEDQVVSVHHIRHAVRSAIVFFGERDKEIIRCYILQEGTMLELATKFDITESRVCQIVARFRKKVKYYLEQDTE